MNTQRQDEKQMTLEELIGWLDSNDISYEIDDAGRLTVKGDLRDDFEEWVRTCRYTGLPDEFFCVDGDLWMGQTSIVSLGGLTSLGGNLDLTETPITSLGNLTSVGGGLDLAEVPITSLGNLISVGKLLYLYGTSITSLDNLPQVGGDLCLDQSQLQLLTRGALQKVKKEIRRWDWVILSPDELETIVAENERRSALPHVPS